VRVLRLLVEAPSSQGRAAGPGGRPATPLAPYVLTGRRRTGV